MPRAEETIDRAMDSNLSRLEHIDGELEKILSEFVDARTELSCLLNKISNGADQSEPGPDSEQKTMEAPRIGSADSIELKADHLSCILKELQAEINSLSRYI